MNIAIIGSGGDGAGMNECLYTLCKKLKKYNLILFMRGYQGIIEDDVANFSLKQIKNERTKGGIIIKSSRSADFMTEKGFKKCISVLKKHKIDTLIVMGGNGSLQGAKKLVENGINCLFVPTTIDNDIKASDYSIGFSTAISNAVDFVFKVDISMKAFDRLCIYEVMGRHCPDLAYSVAKQVGACYTFTAKSTKQEMLKAVKTELKTNPAPIIILQENTVDIDELKQFLTLELKKVDVKSAIIGYVQRGGFSTKEDMQKANSFAKKVAYCVNNNIVNKMIIYNQKDNIFDTTEI